MNNFGGAGMGDDGGFGGIDFSKLGAGAGGAGMPGMEGLDAEGGADDSVSSMDHFPLIPYQPRLTQY